ncbi:MAG: hypothetical protein OCD03_07395 [Hyphomicrobiales bacterium]
MKKIAFIIFALALTGCATKPRVVYTPPTTSTTTISLPKLYKKIDYFNFTSNHGYKDKRKGKNGFAVVYSGVGGLHVDIALDFALLRSAELCKGKNLPYFGPSRISSSYQKKRHETEFTPVVFMDTICYFEKIDPALYDTNAVLKAINLKIASGKLDNYKSIIKRKSTVAKKNQPIAKKPVLKNLIY